MPANRPRARLRQVVLAAEDLEAVARTLRAALELGEPFHDPDVGEFGLSNVVFAIGDCFLEVISPTQAGTPAGRWLARRSGDGGYMALFDLEDLEGARERASAMGVRVVWQVDLPEISGTHLHPADMRGAIVSLDRSKPYGSWRWAGPRWTGRIDAPAAGRLRGITVAVPDPGAVAARWGEVLGVEVTGEGPTAPCLLAMEDAEVRFERAASGSWGGIVEIAVETPAELPGGRASIEVGGVRLRRVSPRALRTADRGAPGSW